MSKEDKQRKKVRKAIGKIISDNPGVTIKDMIESFSDWFAFISIEEPTMLAFFMENYLKYVVYYALTKEKKDD